MSKFDLDVLHQTISDTQSNICQAVIVKEGKLIYADTWNGYSINDTVHIASATKSVVALLVGIAIDKGYIDSLEQHILDFFPEYTIKPIFFQLNPLHGIHLPPALFCGEDGYF